MFRSKAAFPHKIDEQSFKRFTQIPRTDTCVESLQADHTKTKLAVWMSKSIHAEEDFKDTPETQLLILPGKAGKKTDQEIC